MIAFLINHNFYVLSKLWIGWYSGCPQTAGSVVQFPVPVEVFLSKRLNLNLLNVYNFIFDICQMTEM